MHELSIKDTVNISGGGDVADAVQVAAAIGSAMGAAYAAANGATGTAVLGAAGIGAAYVSGFTAIGYVGWNIGSAIYDIPAVNEFIADTVDSIFIPTPNGTVTVGPLPPSDPPNFLEGAIVPNASGGFDYDAIYYAGAQTEIDDGVWAWNYGWQG